MRTTALRRAVHGLSTVALVAGGSLLTVPAASAATQQTPVQWLTQQLDDGLVVSGYDAGGTWVTYTDYGLSLDVFLALRSLERRAGVRGEILAAVEQNVDAYVGSGATAYAGATGKLLSAVLEQGIDPATYGAGDLLPRLEALVHTDADAEQGRAKDTWDAGDPWGGDYSNTIGQSFVVEALSAADSPLADEAAGFLLKQQCAAGYFRLQMESADHTCDGGTPAESAPSVDATAFAVLALSKALAEGVPGLQPAAGSALAKARTWLVARQNHRGAFADGGVPNANSTGLAVEALAALGARGAAANGAGWIRRLVVTPALARRTAFRAGDVGAIAFDPAALREGMQKSITQESAYQWRRATAQAVTALRSLLPAKSVAVDAPSRAAKGAKVRVRITGLVKGEHYTLRRNGKVVARGWIVPGKATVVKVLMPQRKRDVRLTVVGSRPVRQGATVVRVR